MTGDRHNIRIISESIGSIASDAFDIKTVYTFPVWEIGRTLPCITALYAGLTSDPVTLGATDLVSYSFDLTLYYPFEGRAVESQWNNVTNIVNDVVRVFREQWDLNGSCIQSQLTRGEPIIEVPKGPAMKPRWMGHTFRIEAQVQEY